MPPTTDAPEADEPNAEAAEAPATEEPSPEPVRKQSRILTAKVNHKDVEVNVDESTAKVVNYLTTSWRGGIGGVELLAGVHQHYEKAGQHAGIVYKGYALCGRWRGGLWHVCGF